MKIARPAPPTGAQDGPPACVPAAKPERLPSSVSRRVATARRISRFFGRLGGSWIAPVPRRGGMNADLLNSNDIKGFERRSASYSARRRLTPHQARCNLCEQFFLQLVREMQFRPLTSARCGEEPKSKPGIQDHKATQGNLAEYCGTRGTKHSRGHCMGNEQGNGMPNNNRRRLCGPDYSDSIGRVEESRRYSDLRQTKQVGAELIGSLAASRAY